jgi:hypothetical protein
LVIVDRRRKRIEIQVKTFWVWVSREYIPFHDIKYVDIAGREVGDSLGYTPDGFGAHDTTEIYYVQVIPKSSPYPKDLFRFIGEGGRNTGWLGVLMGGGVVDCEGAQMEKAQAYAKLVSEYVGVPLWRDRPVETSFESTYRFECPACGHTSHSNSGKCTYCGHVVVKPS